METKKFTILSLCLILIILIGICFGLTFYNNYIKPESYVNGEVKHEPYESTKLLDYMTSEDIVFSAELNKSVFSTTDTKSVCEYTFEHINFDGEKNTYGLYVNDYLLNNVTTTAGTISGDYRYKYYDPEKKVVCDSTVSISFTFYTLKTVARLELNADELPYLMKNLQNNSFVVSIAKTDYKLVSDEKYTEQSSTVTLNIGENIQTFTQVAGSHLALVGLTEKYIGVKEWTVQSGDAIVSGNELVFGVENSVVDATLDSVDFTIQFTGTFNSGCLKGFTVAGYTRQNVSSSYTGKITSSGKIEISTIGQPLPFKYNIDVGDGEYTVNTRNLANGKITIEFNNATKLNIEIISRLDEVIGA